jgi:hypothetical protein
MISVERALELLMRCTELVQAVCFARHARPIAPRQHKSAQVKG